MKIFEKNQDFPKVWMKCLKIARLQDFAPNTPGLLGALSRPQTLCREVRDSHCESTNPPLEIPAYGPDISYLENKVNFLQIYVTFESVCINFQDAFGKSLYILYVFSKYFFPKN